MKSNEGASDFKKIGQYSYLARDIVGKGYSSVVYRAQNGANGTLSFTQDRLLQSS